MKVDPEDFKECCVAMCVDNGETLSCIDLPPNGKALCNNKPTKLIWQIQFLVKDQASQVNKNFYRVLLYSGIDGFGHDFFGAEHPPTNLHKNEQEFKFIKDKLNGLMRYNVWCDAVLVR